jgi:hypothetical protein
MKDDRLSTKEPVLAVHPRGRVRVVERALPDEIHRWKFE